VFPRNRLMAVALIWIVAVVELCAGLADACSVCGCGDPLASAAEAYLKGGQLRLALDTELLSARAATEEPGVEEQVTQYTLRPVVAYAPIDALAFVVQIPVVRKDWSQSGGDQAPTTANPTGLGDVDVAARVFVYTNTRLAQMSRETLALVAGSSLPTGNNSMQENGVRIDEQARHRCFRALRWGNLRLPTRSLEFLRQCGRPGAYQKQLRIQIRLGSPLEPTRRLPHSRLALGGSELGWPLCGSRRSERDPAN